MNINVSINHKDDANPQITIVIDGKDIAKLARDTIKDTQTAAIDQRDLYAATVQAQADFDAAMKAAFCSKGEESTRKAAAAALRAKIRADALYNLAIFSNW